MKPRLCAIACGNGLGHYRRISAVVESLLRRTPDVEVDLYAQAWQTEAAGAPPARMHREAMAGSPRWDARTWSAEVYDAWLDRLAAEEPVRRADVVLSDNLAGVLRIRPDAVLMGSFLWHDVAGGAGIAAEPVVSLEEDLLARHQPPMLCVEEMAMPAVTRLTRAVGLPWFCDFQRPPAGSSWPPRRVLLMGGATGVLDDALRQLARVLGEHTGLELTAPPRLAEADGSLRGRVEPFAFSDGEFAACDLVLGRPGMGTLTDCVRHGLPILCVGDDGNPELRHNAARVEALGIGARVRIDDSEATVRLLSGGLDRARYAEWCRNLSLRPTGGTERAAEAVAAHLDLVPA
jgi:hypothetical protein